MIFCLVNEINSNCLCSQYKTSIKSKGMMHPVKKQKKFDGFFGDVKGEVSKKKNVSSNFEPNILILCNSTLPYVGKQDPILP